MDCEKALKTAKHIESLLHKGYSKEKVKEEVQPFSEESFSIAKAMIKNRRTGKIPQEFIFTEEDLMYATNSLVAKYRAKVLSCNSIVETGCGIGIQSIEFSRACKKVISIDKDARKIEYAKYNSKISNAKNIAFICSDAIQALSKISSADIMFWDPERPRSETERSLGSLSPSFNDFMKNARKITKNICIELPPQIKSQIPKGCELEYISINNQLNRLNAYFGSLKTCSHSAISLPSENKIKNTGKKSKPNEVSIKDYIYELDDSIIKANILPNLCSQLKSSGICKIGSKICLTSKIMLSSPFLKAYEVLGNPVKDNLTSFLVSKNIGKVILHGSIKENDYWNIKNSIEKEIKGTTTAHLFFLKDSVIVALKR
ncbi:methyltransferase [Candidatus Woesearchaeota archaeon]|nr:methyltransferase [Candidatus Woesearchaeota archaeon]